MSKFYAYRSKSGGYIQTNVDGHPQVLQVAPSAEDLLKELGFEYGAYVPRDVTKPLIILGVLETKPHGRTKRELLDGLPKLSVQYCELDPTQQATLRSYLQERVPDLTHADYELLSEFLRNESTLAPLAHQPDSADERGASSAVASHPPVEAAAIDVAAIPTALRRYDQWLCWRTDMRDGKATKVPISPHEEAFAKVDDSSTWGSFEVAVDALSRDDVDGLGFVFTDADTFAGIDIDDVRDPEAGSLTATAEDIVSTLESYTEVSPSGTGLHVIIQGFVPDGRQRHDGIELYDSGRFFTVTGEHLDDTPSEVAVRHHELAAIHGQYVARDTAAVEPSDHSGETVQSGVTEATTDLNAERVIEYGKQNETFRRLWNGDTSGYPSHSEADMALCCLLAYYTGDDYAMMDALFRQSGLMREKWDEQRGDQTYGELTLEKAIQYVDDYDPRLHGHENSSSTAAIAHLEPEDTATIEGTVDTVESIPAEEIDQAGELVDDSGRIRFVVWNSEYWGLDAEFSEGDTYRLLNAWVTEYEGQREVHINEHTAIEAV